MKSNPVRRMHEPISDDLNILHGRSGRVSLSNSRMSYNSQLSCLPVQPLMIKSSWIFSFSGVSVTQLSETNDKVYIFSKFRLVIKTNGSCSNKVSADSTALSSVCLDLEPHPQPHAKAMSCFPIMSFV